MNMSNFAERLSELIFDEKLSVPQFAEKLDCKRATINRYLSGTRMPDTKIAVKMADFFQCTVDFLLGNVEQNDAKSFTPYVSFKGRLTYLCKLYHTTKYQINKQTKLAYSALDYWDNGERTPSIDSIGRLAQFFDCSMDFILGREK